MKQKIETKDILKGDTIRKEYKDDTASSLRADGAVAFEYVATKDRHDWNNTKGEFFLLNRPVVLPTEEGYYESERYPTGKGFDAYQLTRGGWYMGSENMPEVYMRSIMPLRKMGTERDIALKVLDEVLLDLHNGYLTTKETIELVRKRYNK